MKDYFNLIFTEGKASPSTAANSGRVPATAPCNKSRGQVPSRELVSFALRDKLNFVHATSPTYSSQFDLFVTGGCDLFVKTETSPFM